VLTLAPYAGVLLAAIIEGEVTYIAAAALVAQGQLNPLAVLVCGALGAAIGDQAFFYVFRGRLPLWIARYPSLQTKAAPLVSRVRRHAALMVLMIRFAPGLRIAIAAACAWVDMPARTFSLLNLLSAFVWAFLLLAVVGWLGPAWLGPLGLGGWKGALVLGVIAFVLLKMLGGYERRVLDRPDCL
jgi:undecaprenyl-diphosphatase